MAKRTTDEHSKETVADQVVSEKRQYFVSEHGLTVDADTPVEAVKNAKKLKKKSADNDIDATQTEANNE